MSVWQKWLARLGFCGKLLSMVKEKEEPHVDIDALFDRSQDIDLDKILGRKKWWLTFFKALPFLVMFFIALILIAIAVYLPGI